MSQRFNRILNAALNRDGTKAGDSLIVPNHLAQMKLFGIRQGVEIYPIQDRGDLRAKFVEKLWKDNKVDLFLERFWDLLLCKGRMCFYLRPNASGGYRIYHYHKDQFKAYYDADGELIEIVIKYSYKVSGHGNMIATNLGRERWVKLRITKDEIIRYDSDFEPEIHEQLGIDFQPSSTSVNTLGWIPCVVVNNYTIEAGQDGVDEFSWLSDNIEAHDRMVEAIRKNVEFFGNPTLISSRTLGELTEGGVIQRPVRPTLASQSGMVGQWTGSSYKSDPSERFEPELGLRIRKVIANVESDDRIGYIVPDPVSPDQTRFAAEYRESLHTALGGVDPLGISTGATAYEIKSLFGRTAATARKRADHLYTYGICKVFEMAIAAEEIKLKRAVAQALEVSVDMVTDDGLMLLLETGKSPSGKKLPKDFVPVGLPPLGDRTIAWRWTGPVFEDSPQDILQKSIVVRNMEEVGVETSEAVRFMLPDKTEKEIRMMLTGFPFREMQESGSSLGQHLSILGQMMNTPNPVDPGVPLGLSFNNMEVIMKTLDHISKRLNYGNPIDPAANSGASAFTPVPSVSPDEYAGLPASAPNQLPAGPAAGITTAGPISNPYGAINAAAGNVPGESGGQYGVYDLSTGRPLPTDPLSNAGIPNPTTNWVGQYPGAYAAGQPQYAGQANAIPEYADTLPIPGSTIGSDSIPAGTSSVSPSPAAISGVPADLATSPNILRQLFPTIFAVSDAARGNRKRRGNRK